MSPEWRRGPDGPEHGEHDEHGDELRQRAADVQSLDAGDEPAGKWQVVSTQHAERAEQQR